MKETATTIYTMGNVDDAQNFSATAMAPIKIMKNWETSNTFTLSYDEYNFVDGDSQLKNNHVFYMFQTNHNTLLPHNFKMEISGFYRSPRAYALYELGRLWFMNAGLKKSFLENKLEVSFNVNDIFGTYRLRNSTKIGDNINDFDQDLRMQYMNIGMRYNFSSGLKFQSRNRSTGPEEVQRT